MLRKETEKESSLTILETSLLRKHSGRPKPVLLNLQAVNRKGRGFHET